MRRLAIALALFAMSPLSASAQVPIATNLETSLSFEGNVTDDTGNVTYTDNNTVGFTTGKIGQCVQLVAANSESVSGPLMASEVPTELTIEFWANRVESTTDMLIVEWGTTVNRQFGPLIFTDGNIYATVQDGGIGGSIYPDTTEGDWHHYVYVFDGSGGSEATRLKLYRDGAEVAFNGSGGVPTQYTVTGDFYVGAETLNSRYTQGLIDEVRVWSRALDSADVTWLYNSGNGRSYAEIVPPVSTFIPQIIE